MRKPPAVGRARLRGETIRRLSGKANARCNWTAVFDPDGSTLDLRDPFATSEVWTLPSAPPPDIDDLPPDIPPDDSFGDPGRFRQMLDAMRRRYGRTRNARTESPPQTTEG